MITITVERNGTRREARVADEHAPALRSALEEIRNEVGGRLEGNHAFAKEAALTNASIALAALAGALNGVVLEDDPFYA